MQDYDEDDTPWFEYNEYIHSVSLSNGVTSIGSGAFYECTELTSITIPNSVTSIGTGAFSGCTGLTSITIPNSVTSIGDYAFYGCTGFTAPVYNSHVFAYMPTTYSGAYTIPDGIESIAGGAFRYCTGLTSITIPNSVTSIGQRAFYECTGLTSITIGESVMSIGQEAFLNCTGLTSITIPNNVTSIGDYAFYGCTVLSSLTIGESVTSIGDYAFAYCKQLYVVTCLGSNPAEIGEHVFYTETTGNTYAIYVASIIVPCGSLNAYKTAWAEYTDYLMEECIYTITFVNWDGTTLQSLQVAKGDRPYYRGETPARPEDEQYTYSFWGWTPDIVVATEDATYTATFLATEKQQGIEDVNTENDLHKVLRDGQIFILRGDHTYTLTGQEVK